jgi:hypothetical protein
VEKASTLNPGGAEMVAFWVATPVAARDGKLVGRRSAAFAGVELELSAFHRFGVTGLGGIDSEAEAVEKEVGFGPDGGVGFLVLLIDLRLLAGCAAVFFLERVVLLFTGFETAGVDLISKVLFMKEISEYNDRLDVDESENDAVVASLEADMVRERSSSCDE